LAGAAPGLSISAAFAVLAALCFGEAPRIARQHTTSRPGAVRPHSAHVGTAEADHAAIAHHDDKEQQMNDETDETCDCGGCDDGPDYGRIDETTSLTGDPR
jgi:hypothetical protein